MLPKKLFTPKCLHADRDTVFHEDLGNFYNFIICEMLSTNKNDINFSSEENSNKIFPKDSVISNSNPNLNLDHTKLNKKKIKNSQFIANNQDSEKAGIILHNLNYSIFKYYWRIKEMSMLHFSKSKEENSKEFYEVLFGEVQNFLLSGNEKHPLLSKIIKIFAIYSLYSLYYTQTSEYFYQINTIPEVLAEINHLLKDNSPDMKFIAENYTKVKKEIAIMTNKLYHDDAFSVGTLVGIKTIILNKYGLPLEQRSNVYRDYVDINNTKILLDNMKIEEKQKNRDNNLNLEEYVNIKRDTVNLLKNINLSSKNFNSQLYCDFINEKMKNSGLAPDFHMPYQNENNMLNIDLTFFPNDIDMLNIRKEDFERNRITNLDLQFNQIENNI